MKRIVIGDPHGRWGYIKQIYDKEQPDEVIILGDYFDSFDVDNVAWDEFYKNSNKNFVCPIFVSS